MSIYTLQDLRATAPAHLRNVSDYALINEYAKSSGVDPMQVAQYFGLGQQGGMASNRIAAGVDNYQANMYGLVGAGARALGANQVAGWADRNREANELQADIATLRARDLGAVDDWRDVRGIGSGLNYVGGLAAQSLPYLAEAAVGGLAARGVMTGTRAALAAAQTPQAAAAARRALNIGSMAGAVGASYPSAVGDVLSNQRDEAGVENLGSAAIGGVPYAALNAIGAEGVVARGLRPLSGVTGRRMLRRMGDQGWKTALTEGAAETGQEMVNQYFGRMAVNPDQTMFNEDANRRYLDSFVGGAALGGSIGTLAGVRRPIDETFNYDLTQRGLQPRYNLTTDMQPLQERIDRNLGINQRTTPGDYAKLFEEAASEGSGQFTVDPQTGVERELSMQELLEIQSGVATQPAADAVPVAAPSAPTNQTQAAVDENADLDELIIDRTSLKPSNKMRSFAKRIVGLDLETADPDTEVAVWNALAERKYGAAEKLLKAFEESAAANDRQNVVAPAGAPATQPGTGDIPALPTAATPDAAVAAVTQPPAAGAGQPVGVAQNTADQGAVNRVVSSGGSTAASLPASASAGVGVSSTQTNGTQTAQAQQAAPQGSAAASIRPATQSSLAPTGPDWALNEYRNQNKGTTREAAARYGLRNLSSELQAIQRELRNPTWSTNTTYLQGRAAEIEAQMASIDAALPELTRMDDRDSSTNTQRWMLSSAKQELDAAVAEGVVSPQDAEEAVERARATGNTVLAVDEIENTVDTAVGRARRPATGQVVKAVGVTGRSKLTLKRNEPGDLSLEDRAEIESLTGAGGEARALLSEEMGRRQDAPSDEVQAQMIRDILAKRFEESTDAARDTEIALAYLTALRAAPKGSKIKVQEAIGERYGIKPVTVRKIGNTSKMVEAGRALGYSDREVRALLDINDNTKARPGESVQGEETSTAEDTQLTQGLRDAGVETLEGETAGFGFDDARTWSAPENAAEAKAAAVQSLMDQIEGMRETIAELEGQGQTEVAQALSEQVAALHKRLEAAIADYNKFLGGDKRRAAEAPKTALPEDVTAAKQRLKEAKGDVTKLSDEDLPLIRGEYARLKNTDGVAKVEAEMQKRGMGTTAEAAPESAQAPAEQPKAKLSKVAKPPQDSGQTLWEKLRGDMPDLAPYDDLTANEKGYLTELADRTNGKPVLSKEVGLQQLVADRLVGGGTEFGEAATPENAYTAKELEAELKAFMRVDALGRNVIIVDKPTDLDDMRDVVTGLTNVRAFGWTRDGKAVLVASRIQKGMGRAKFMHEVGSHLGMQRLLPPAVFNRLVDQVIEWAARSDNRLETRLAKKALARVPEDTAPASVRNEIVAYFVEEAVMAGVNPTATNQLQSPVLKWFRSLMDAFNRALVKLGAKPESLRAKDYVNLAYGAASLRMDATPGGSSDVELGSQAITDTPAFKRWFGDSKVVDAEGKPLVVYHGTRGDFDTFDAGRQGQSDFGASGRGFYFSQDPDTANVYATLSPADGAPNIVPVYLKLENPLELGAMLPQNEEQSRALTEAAKEAGHDGIVVRGADGVLDEVVVFSPEQIKSAIGNRGTFDPNDARIEFGMNPAPAAPTASTIQKNIAKLPKPMQGPVRGVLNTIADAARSALDKVVFTHVLIDRAKAAGIKSADRFSRLLAERAAKARELEREVEKIADMYADVEEKDKGDGSRSLNRFLFESTRQGKWGYGDNADPDMKVWFDELGKNSQKLARAIFAHGDKILAQKKQAVIDYTNTEYDALIEAAQERLAAATTADERKDARKELAELKRDKADSLKKYETLFNLREGSPYAPIKRMGNYVVVAKSAEYRAAEEAGDTKKMAELEKDGEHYHVSFTETKNEARRLADNLREQGFYGRDNEAVYFMERSTTDEELFGGDSMLQALTKLRARVDGTDNKGRAALQRMVTELWLNALAENSARKSEMRRKGVDGEVDMLRSFAAQGRADAQFIASVRYNAATQESIQAMRNEVKRGGDRLRKSEIMNELMERYATSLDVVHTPVVDKITRMSSVYFLASSPMYYLQNLTQPWMMSVPAMAKTHDYTKVSSALYKAYSELGPVMRSGKLFETGFDFDQVPADVKEAIKTLVNRGRIDIGLDTELGEFRIDGQGAFADGWNKVDKGLRLLVQKGEAINRLSTAIAAYRLELGRTNSVEAALDYTDKILLDTHGDYGRFNAPKYFNTSLGRIALQFRKFQLIQLTWYAKLIKDAFTNPAERKAALKGLGFALGHTALLAGVMGLPGYAAIAWALGQALGDDDEKFDLTYELRRFIGDETMANLIMRGTPTLAGADISGKVGAGTMLSIMPFSNADLSTPQGQAQAAGTLIGGASLGMATRIADGLGLMLSGDWVRGAELVLPKGLGDAIRGAREASDGVTRRNGDVILPPEEVSAVEAVMQAIGMPPVQTTVTNERRSRAFEMDKHFRERTTRIKNDYTKAARRGDAEGMRQAREAWMRLQDARVKAGYTRQPMSNLLKAPQEQARRERDTAGGVQFNRSNAAFAREQASF